MSTGSAEAGIVLYTMMTPLPEVDTEREPPEWITVFPELGAFTCRDGRKFTVDAEALIAVFIADGVELPIDINHATDWAMGERADAVAWIKELRVHNAQLQARVEWLAEGKALLAAKSYKYQSPSFYQDKGNVTRLKGVSLVNSPAIANQPALASAAHHPNPEPTPMKSIALALGLVEAASEVECLTALKDRLTNSVSKQLHDETLAQLSATSTELADIKKANRDEKVDRLVEEALSAKKITPAEKDHYVALCSTDDGLVAVEKLLDAKTPLLAGSGISGRSQPEDDVAMDDPVKLAQLAAELQDKEAAAGRTISLAQAMTRVTEQRG
jgi:Mu-like prophage I protein